MPAIHAGQADVADQQVDALGRIQNRHRAVGITGLDEGIPQITQHGTDQYPYCRIVFDNQHGLAFLRVRRMLDIDRTVLWQLATEARQIQVHRGAFTDFALNGDVTARLFAEAINHR
ncbi:hypothetical protein D3C81_1839860 [compost metagenome]